jgi:hypothetical protein
LPEQEETEEVEARQSESEDDGRDEKGQSKGEKQRNDEGDHDEESAGDRRYEYLVQEVRDAYEDKVSEDCLLKGGLFEGMKGARLKARLPVGEVKALLKNTPATWDVRVAHVCTVVLGIATDVELGKMQEEADNHGRRCCSRSVRRL